MAEYIKKEAILDLLKNKYQDMSAMPASYYKGFQYALKTIEKIKPAADVGPVRRGHWYDKGSLSCRCSECGCKSNRENNYCPHCGAKMDLEG